MSEAHHADGWSQDYFTELLQAHDQLSNVAYEIRNCVRQRRLSRLAEELQDVIDSLETMQEALEADAEHEERE